VYQGYISLIHSVIIVTKGYSYTMNLLWIIILRISFDIKKPPPVLKPEVALFLKNAGACRVGQWRSSVEVL
jgi:hypothetical protein